MDLHKEYEQVAGLSSRTHTITANMVFMKENLHTLAPISLRDERGYPMVSVMPHKGSLGAYVDREKDYMNSEIDDTVEPFALSRIERLGKTVMVVLTGAVKHRQDSLPTEIVFVASPRDKATKR